MEEITLTHNEVHLAAVHAVYRRIGKLRGERKEEKRQKEDADTWDNEVEAACAELAWCKHRRVFWTGVSGLGARDSATEEVRWTRWCGTGGLMYYPDRDKDDSVFVLMDGTAPNFRVCGWLEGREMKKLAEKKNYGWRVPREKLRQIEDLF